MKIPWGSKRVYRWSFFSEQNNYVLTCLILIMDSRHDLKVAKIKFRLLVKNLSKLLQGSILFFQEKGRYKSECISCIVGIIRHTSIIGVPCIRAISIALQTYTCLPPGIKDLPCSTTSFPGPFPGLGAGAEYPKPGKRPWEWGCLFYSMVGRAEKLRLTWTHWQAQTWRLDYM